MGENPKTGIISLFDLDERISGGSDSTQFSYTPQYITKGLLKGIEREDNRLFLEAYVWYSFTLAVILATTKNKALRTEANFPKSDAAFPGDGYPGARNGPGVKLYDEWIAQHVHSKHRKSMQDLLSNPVSWISGHYHKHVPLSEIFKW